ncbi:(S)-benzoin forming benzil reductase [Paenibacillus paeoniae]|uniref:(S)-benzoin forming benzil reductase n=1 Tax=Paenibacillus paeoniae TaxID=2292705 RepID=A0A371PMD9_9BACL|nr:(S)-benzoin forming benzil reductase [Paenibacillus paeoniae]REK76937.1 (S)-benzoin forming benzil reductase [Paenibacillus paeoniae]
MKAYIITGTSRGIGEAMAEQLLKSGNSVYCISRNVNVKLEEVAVTQGAQLSYHTYDLNELTGIDQLMETIIASVKQAPDLEGVYLINNAGVLSPVMPIEQCESELIIQNVTINLLAPMILTSRFIELTKELDVDKRVMNVSSGSAKFLLPAQSCYSTSKSGIDTFSRSINLEQQHASNPVKIASVYPGMIDTVMQAEIRSASKENFPYVDQFIQLAKDGLLQTPEDTATKLLDLLLSKEYGQSPLVEQL